MSSAPVLCSPGYFAGDIGLSSCSVCPQGFYATSNGTKECQPCPVSHMCPLPQAEPIPCEGREYQPEVGKGFCLPLPVGAVIDTNGTAISCTVRYLSQYFLKEPNSFIIGPTDLVVLTLGG